MNFLSSEKRWTIINVITAWTRIISLTSLLLPFSRVIIWIDTIDRILLDPRFRRKKAGLEI